MTVLGSGWLLQKSWIPLFLNQTRHPEWAWMLPRQIERLSKRLHLYQWTACQAFDCRMGIFYQRSLQFAWILTPYSIKHNQFVQAVASVGSFLDPLSGHDACVYVSFVTVKRLHSATSETGSKIWNPSVIETRQIPQPSMYRSKPEFCDKN